MNKKILLDTNVLLSNPDILDKNPEKYVICLTTLRELDKLKRVPELNYSVRHAIKSIKRNFKDLQIEINEKIDPENMTNDEKIILVAKNNNLTFKTEDIGAWVLALIEKIEIDEDDVDDEFYDSSFTGYIEEKIKDDSLWNVLYHSGNSNEELIIEFGKDLLINQYKVLFNSKDLEEYIIIYKNKDNDIIQVPLKKYKKAIENIGIKVKPYDAYQWMVIDACLNDSSIVVIDGILGTGKTLLSIIGALIQVKSHDNFFKKYDKIYVSKPPEGINKEYKMGYLPGDLEEGKLAPWLLGFKTNLEFLYETDEESKDEQKANGIFSKYFKPISLEHIQGASLHNSIFLFDEYQLLDRDTMHQLLSRIESSSKIIIMGDPDGQSYNKNRGNEGYRVLRRHIKNKELLSYVKLKNIYRSELAKFVEEIFKN